MTKLSSLSIIFPAYNEAGNIEEAIKQALHVLPQVAKTYKIIVVNDGSTDATALIVRRLKKKNNRIQLINQKNTGYGGALTAGFAKVKTDWAFFTDSDLQFDLQELKKLVKKSKKFKLVIGYRIKRAEGWKRVFVAKLLKTWNRVFLRFPSYIRDIDCAFKLIHTDVLRSVSPLQSTGAMISTEFLLKAHRANIEIAQAGVHHYQRRIGTPTGNNLSVILKAVKETAQLRLMLAHERVNHLSWKLGFVR